VQLCSSFVGVLNACCCENHGSVIGDNPAHRALTQLHVTSVANPLDLAEVAIGCHDERITRHRKPHRSVNSHTRLSKRSERNVVGVGNSGKGVCTHDQSVDPGFSQRIYTGFVAVPKILLFYVFTPLPDPEAVRLWQRDVCESLGLRGRILISKDGINGTVGGELADVKKYARKLREYGPFSKVDLKWSEGNGDDFPRLSVKVRDEIVSFGAPGELKVDENGVVGGGTKLSPNQLHELIEKNDVTFFDGRNAFEAEIGRFEGAIVPDVETTRDFVAELESGKYDHLKNTPVVTYCTGGIRCEVLSALMVERGFDEVYQLDGGIVRYGETFGDSGLWKGSLYVFDNRISMDFTNAAEVIGRCYVCDAATKNMRNCRELSCREQLVVCEEHAPDTACAAHVATFSTTI